MPESRAAPTKAGTIAWMVLATTAARLAIVSGPAARRASQFSSERVRVDGGSGKGASGAGMSRSAVRSRGIGMMLRGYRSPLGQDRASLQRVR